jgi:transcription initiation factor TFIIIB Brf1 subunit/transcription initiation factor TFIIB
VIIDHRAGSDVCTACGLVLEPVFGEQIQSVKLDALPSVSAPPSYARQFLQNICIANGWELSFPVIESALHLYEKFGESHLFSSRNKDTFLAFSVYEACQQHGCAITYRELERWCGVSRSAIGKIERAFAGKILITSEKERRIFPSSLITRYGPLLDFERWDVHRLQDILITLYGFGNRCPHVLTAALFVYYVELNKRSIPTIKRILETFDVTYYPVIKTAREIKEIQFSITYSQKDSNSNKNKF